MGSGFGDYEVSLTGGIGGVTRIEFLSSYLSSEEGLSEGDVVFISYIKA